MSTEHLWRGVLQQKTSDKVSSIPENPVIICLQIAGASGNVFMDGHEDEEGVAEEAYGEAIIAALGALRVKEGLNKGDYVCACVHVNWLYTKLIAGATHCDRAGCLHIPVSAPYLCIGVSFRSDWLPTCLTPPCSRLHLPRHGAAQRRAGPPVRGAYGRAVHRTAGGAACVEDGGGQHAQDAGPDPARPHGHRHRVAGGRGRGQAPGAHSATRGIWHVLANVRAGTWRSGTHVRPTRSAPTHMHPIPERSCHPHLFALCHLLVARARQQPLL